MYLIGVYDINSKRVQKVLKTFRRYLTHVQKSVFEGEISESNFKKLNNDLSDLLKKKEDYVIFYRVHHKKVFRKIELGKKNNKLNNIL
jgi:CRISPR-associated protein Cas2